MGADTVARFAVLLSLAVLCAISASCGGGNRGGLIQPHPGATDRAADPVAAGLDQVLAEIEEAAAPAGVDAELWTKLTAELQRILTARTASEIVQHPPAGEANRVADLELVDDGGGYSLQWTYVNVGDYNRDGLVGVSDLTPIGQYYEVAEGDPQWDVARYADGNGDGQVTVSDITQIGQNYLSQVSAYEVQGSYLLDGPWDSVDQVAYVSPDSTDPVAFVYPLVDGDYSTYSVVPIDTNGNQGVHSLFVAVAPPRLSSPLSPAPNIGLTDSDNDVVFTIGLAESAGSLLSAELVEVDGEGNQLAVIGELWDDGDEAHGDQAASDSILSAKTTINRANEGLYYFRANITLDDGGTVSFNSNTTWVELRREITDERLDEIAAQLHDFSEQLGTMRETMTPAEADAEMVELLRADPGISEAGIKLDDAGVWYTTSEGFGCGISFPDPIIYPYEPETSTARIPAASSAYWQVPQTGQATRQASYMNPEMPASYNALILAPFDHIMGINGGEQMKEKLPQATNSGEVSRFNRVDYWANDDCTLDKFLDLYRYGVIIIFSIGDVDVRSNKFGAEFTSFNIYTGTEVSEDNSPFYTDKERSLLKHGVAKFGSVHLKRKNEFGELINEVREYIVVDQTDIDQQPKSHASFVFLGVSHSASQKSTLPQAFGQTKSPTTGLTDIIPLGGNQFLTSSLTEFETDHYGAGTVYGFDKSVNYPFALAICHVVFRELLMGKDTSQIFNTPPQLGVAPYDAYALLPGVKNNSVKLVTKQFPNYTKQALRPKPYQAVSVDLPEGASGLNLQDINDSNQVLGTYSLGSQQNRLAIWQVKADRTTSRTNIDYEGQDAGGKIIASISDAGVIAGYYDGASGVGAQWTCAGPTYSEIKPLSEQEGVDWIRPYDINGSGEITGQARFDPEASYQRAMLYVDGTYTNLGELPARDSSLYPPYTYSGVSITDDAPVIVGKADSLPIIPGPVQSYGFIYSNGELAWLAIPARGIKYAQNSVPNDIAANDWIVGKCSWIDGVVLPWLWRPAEQHPDQARSGRLPTFRSSLSGNSIEYGIANSVNSRWQIVGTARSPVFPSDAGTHAVIWEYELYKVVRGDGSRGPDRELFHIYDLNSLVANSPPVPLQSATKINEDGLIIANCGSEAGFGPYILVPESWEDE